MFKFLGRKQEEKLEKKEKQANKQFGMTQDKLEKLIRKIDSLEEVIIVRKVNHA